MQGSTLTVLAYLLYNIDIYSYWVKQIVSSSEYSLDRLLRSVFFKFVNQQKPHLVARALVFECKEGEIFFEP